MEAVGNSSSISNNHEENISHDEENSVKENNYKNVKLT